MYPTCVSELINLAANFSAFVKSPPPLFLISIIMPLHGCKSVSYTHLRAHETDSYLVCRLLLEKKKKKKKK